MTFSARGLLVTLLSSGAALLLVSSASAATQTATDPNTGFVVTVNGAEVTVAAGLTTTPHRLQLAQGKATQVTCTSGDPNSTGYVSPISLYPTTETENSPFPDSGAGELVWKTKIWPAGTASLTVTMERDLSATVQLCSVASPQRDAKEYMNAWVGFTPAGRKAADAWVNSEQLPEVTRAYQDLSDAYKNLKAFVAVNDGRLPTVKQAVGAIKDSERNWQVRIVPTLASVSKYRYRKHHFYVIRKGSTRKTLLVANKDSLGTVHLLKFSENDPYNIDGSYH